MVEEKRRSVRIKRELTVRYRYNINQDLPLSKEQIVEFTADQAGTFSIKCTVFCGFGHGGMTGRLIVQEEKKAAAEKMPMMH